MRPVCLLRSAWVSSPQLPFLWPVRSYPCPDPHQHSCWLGTEQVVRLERELAAKCESETAKSERPNETKQSTKCKTTNSKNPQITSDWGADWKPWSCLYYGKEPRPLDTAQPGPLVFPGMLPATTVEWKWMFPAGGEAVEAPIRTGRPHDAHKEQWALLFLIVGEQYMERFSRCNTSVISVLRAWGIFRITF